MCSKMQYLHQQHYRLISKCAQCSLPLPHCSACNAVYEIYTIQNAEKNLSQCRKNTFVFKRNSQLYRQPSIALLLVIKNMFQACCQ